MAILFYLWTRRCDPGGFRDVRPLVDPRPPGGLGHPVHTFQSRDSRLSTGAVRDWRAVARVHRWNLYREHLYDAHVGLILVGPANRRQRASTRQMKCSPLKGVRSGQNCPQLRVLSAAKKGSISAQLALLREKAVGRRIEIYWHVDRKFYPATITAFDDQNYLHRVEHDDGDIEPAVKLWELRINLLVQDDEKEALQGNASQTITTETPRARKRAAGVKRFWPFGSK